MNTMVRTLVLCIMLVQLGTGAVLSAQDNQAETGLAKVDAASRSITNSLVQTLRTLPRQNEKYRLQLGSFPLDGGNAALGSLWANNLVTYLASAAAAPGANIVLTLQDTRQPDFLVEGELVLAGDTIRIYTRLVRTVDGSIVRGVWSDLSMDPVLAGLTVPTGPADRTGRDSYEPDSRESPASLGLGEDPVERTLHADDTDWFTVQATGTGILVVQTMGEMDTLMSLHAPGSSSALQEDDDSGEGDNARIEYPVAAGQTYLVEVEGYEGATGSYSVSAALELLPSQTGRNDSQERATLLSPDGVPIRLVLGRADEADWFKLDIPASGGVLQLKTTGNMDMLMELHDERGNKLAEDDDSGDGGNAIISSILEAGQYFIKVYEYEGKLGIYQLEAKLTTAGPADQYEPDDSRETAKPVQLGSPQRRNFNHPGDIDWVVLNISRKALYGISARPPRDNGLDTYIELYDAAGQLLAEDDDGGRNMDAYLETELAAGRYFLKVWQLDDEVPGDGVYELLVRLP